MKTLPAIALSFGVLVLGAAGYLAYQQQLPTVFVTAQTAVENLAASSETVPETPTTATIFLGGDVMMDRGVERRILGIGGGDFSFPFQEIMQATNAADLAFINFEGAMSDIGADTGKPYSFNFDIRAINGITAAGIDVVSLANNHMLDWGYDALCDTYKRITAAGVAVVGAGCNKAEADAPFVTTLPDGTTVAFLAFTEFYKGAQAGENRPGLALWTKTNIQNQIQALRSREDVDLIFVSVHWGTEYMPTSNSFQKEWGRMMIDAGADVIVGHHPHVRQEIEQYNGKYIIYSLGNFVFDQSHRPEAMKGLAVEITTEEGILKNLKELPIQMNQNFQPTIVNHENSN